MSQDCDDTDAILGSTTTDADCDRVDCDDTEPNSGDISSARDGDGVRSEADCDDADPSSPIRTEGAA